MNTTLSLLSGALLLLLILLSAVWVGAFLRFSLGRWLKPLMAGCLLLAALAIGVLLTEPLGPGTLVAVASLVSVGLLFGVQWFARQPDKPLPFRVGGPILPFVAPDGEGLVFDLESMRGQAYLLKFYRGYWCPFCIAELKQWNAMLPELTERGVGFVAISPDTVEETRLCKRLHGFGFRVLADPDLQVTDRYNLRSNRTPALGVGRSGLRPLAVPTTILVDEQGIVRWIDRATDYQVRADPRRVLAAIEAALR